MKKLILIILLLSLVSCSTLKGNYYDVTKEELATSSGNKAGILVLDNGAAIYFTSSYLFIDKEHITIMNADIRQEISWRKVRTIHIYNETLQTDYIEQLKKLDALQKSQKEIKAIKK